MKLLAEEMQIAAGFIPVDLAGGANDGDWVSLSKYRRCDVVLYKRPGSATEAPTITMEQAQAVAGTGAKALTFTRIDKKQDADLFTVGQFTKVIQAAAATFTETSLGTHAAIIVIGFNAEDLDVEGGFDCLRVRVADVGTTAQIGAALYLLSEPRYAPPPSAIID